MFEAWRPRRAENPSDEELRRFDKKRPNKKVSNDDWESPHDPDSRIIRMKYGTTHPAYKAEHVVDLDTDLVLAAEIYSADRGDSETLAESLVQRRRTSSTRTARRTLKKRWPTKRIMRPSRWPWSTRPWAFAPIFPNRGGGRVGNGASGQRPNVAQSRPTIGVSARHAAGNYNDCGANSPSERSPIFARRADRGAVGYTED